jgi:CubicO group peptidase (beta-lactamase class C family)
MWRTAAIAIGLLTSGVVLCRAAAPTTNVDELADRLEQLRQLVRIPGFSAAIARDDRVVWAKGFGLADVENEVPATPQTCYHLASLTKTFAATVIFQLVEAGKINLDAPVSEYGIELKDTDNDAVLVKHLMSHTSEGTPGTRFSYNGARFALLDKVIEKASGQSFGQLVCQRIIAPLELRHTAPNVQDATNFALAGHDRTAFEQAVAKPYELDKSLKLILGEYPTHFSGSAGLMSSAPDVARYSIALDQGKLLSQESLERAFTANTLADGKKSPYGLGWFVLDHPSAKLVWHYGLWTCNSSMIIKVPTRRLTFVMLANSDRLSRMYLFGVGNLLSSPFARAFVEGFVAGDGQLPRDAISEP